MLPKSSQKIYHKPCFIKKNENLRKKNNVVQKRNTNLVCDKEEVKFGWSDRKKGPK